MARKKGNKAQNNQNNNKGKEKSNDFLCPHVKKSFDLNRVKHHQQDQCDTCIKQKQKPSNQPLKWWICLKCGGKSCTRDHAMLHFMTPRSDNHSVFIDSSNITIWCFACKEFQIDIDLYKNLKSSISDLERIIRDMSLKKPEVKTNENKNQNNTSCYIKDKDKQETSFNAIGLINEGNTCYANSVFQCLTRTPKLDEAIINDFDNPITLTMENGEQVEFCISRSDCERSDKGALNLVEEYLRLHGILTNKSNNNLKISSGIHILKSLNRKHQQFKWDQQHDAHEFLRMLLDTLRSDIHKMFQALILKKKNLSTPSLQKNASLEIKAEIKEIDRKLCKDKSFGPEKIFGGELVSELRCKECNTFSKSIEEQFMDLSLPVISIDSEGSETPNEHKGKRRNHKKTGKFVNKVPNYSRNGGGDESKIDEDVLELVKDEPIEKQKLTDVHEVNEDDKNSNTNGFNDSGINDSDVPQSRSGSQASNPSDGVATQNYQPSEKPWDFIKEGYSEKEKEVAKADSADSALHEMSLFSEANNDPKPSEDLINNDDKIDIDENPFRNDELDDYKDWNNRVSPSPEKFDSSEEEKDRSSSNHSWMNWSPEKHRVVSDWLYDSTRFVDGPEPNFIASPPIYCNDKRCPSTCKHEETTVFENDGKPLLSSMVYGGGPDMSIIVLHNSDLKDDDGFIKQKVDEYFEPLPDGSAAGSKKMSEALNYLENDEKRYSQESCRKTYPPHRVPMSEEAPLPNSLDSIDKKEENKDCLDIVGEKTTFGETLENGGDSDEGLCISSLFDNDVFQEEEMKIYKVKNDTSSSLEGCLQEFIKEEILTGSNKVGCEECTKRSNDEKTVYTTFSKQLLIKKLPDVVILHLKRFQVQMSSVCKVNRFVSFPVILNMAPYCVQKKKEDLFHLYGVVKHSGGIHSGHYEAYYAHFKKDEEVEWFHANDRTVTKVKECEVLSTQAYLLFYCRLPS